MSHGNTLRALQLACASVGAVTKAQLIHLGHHSLSPALGLGTALRQKSQRAYTRGHKQHGGAVLTSSNTSAATNAGRCIHTLLGPVVRDKDIVGILRRSGTYGNEAAGLQNLVKCSTVNHKILYNRESCASPRLYRNGGAILKMTHKQLAGSHVVVRTMGAPVDVQRASAAYTLAAVVVERYRTAALAAALHSHGVASLADKLLVKDVKHLKEGRIFLYTRNMICFEMALCLGVLLTPYFHIVFH